MVRGGCLAQIRIPNPGLVVPKSGIKSGRIPDILTLSENAIRKQIQANCANAAPKLTKLR